MNNPVLRIQAILRTAIISSLALGTLQVSQAATVTLSPGADIQASVESNGPGTTFILRSGLYRGQVVNPKDNDSFIGQGGTYIIGSASLDFAKDPQGTGLYVATAPSVINSTYGKCAAATPLCSYPQDLYLRAVPQVPASSPKGLKAGYWYFDRQAKKIYLPSNPGAGVAELGVNPYAFSSAATNVTIKNVAVEKYANFAQFGAIGNQNTGAGWIVSNVVVQYNHGVGIKLGTGSQILNSTISMNGELGVSVSGTNSKVTGNIIRSNNYAGYSLDWEGGGSKFSNTTNVLFSNNNVYNNIGPGIWGDSDNINAVFDGNTIWNNLTAGIQYEISYAAKITNNKLYGNGQGTAPSWLWNAQISIQNSMNVQVYGNTVEVSTLAGNGIAVINQNRHPGALGPHIAENDSVYNNTITYDYAIGKSGMVNDTGTLTVYNNKFYDNNYILKTGETTDQHWAWFHYYDWKTFLSASGQEHGGSTVLATSK